MNSSDQSIAFEAYIEVDGAIRVPAPLARRIARPGYYVVRLTPGRRSGRLAGRGVTEEEIDAIAARQLEAREHVVRFLEAEGRLTRDRSFGRRRRG